MSAPDSAASKMWGSERVPRLPSSIRWLVRRCAMEFAAGLPCTGPRKQGTHA